MKFKHYFMEDALEDIIDYRGKTPHKATSGIQTLSAKSVKDGYIDYSNCYFISLEEYNRFMVRGIPKTGDVLLTTEAPLGNVARLDKEDIALAQRLLTLRGKQGVLDTGFLYYYLRSPLGQAKLREKETGTTVTGIKQSEFRRIEIDIPSYAVQKKIVDILGHLDQKIELNRKINKNLEEQIESFLIHALTSSETSINAHLGDYLYIKGRIGWKGLKKSEYLDHSDYRIINGESLTTSGIDWNKAGYISEERYSESPEIMLRVGDILLSKDGTIGKIGYVNKLTTPTSVASGIFVIRNTKPDVISTPFIYYLLKSGLFKAFVAGRTEGSVIPHLYQKDFTEFEFPLPSADKMKEFDDLVTPLFQTVFLNLSENEWLASLRDSLLPRLMSGEIDVSDIDL